ncbi:MAG: SGNH/GDSL hydrolase family protein [Gammaproteobacteria bacterium]|nr:SGNH/GDSL hydrolase family protein [Gammaproteobacteria bacterium]
MFTFTHARNLCALVLSLSLSSLSYGYTQLFSFGDSLSDRGNVFAFSGGTNPPSPYFNGQFSNGDVWTGLLAAQLGVTSSPSLLGGTNHAWGGARTCYAVDPDGIVGEPGCGVGSGVPSTEQQVQDYIDAVGAGNLDSGALYTIWTGGNDINGALGGDTTADYLGAAETVEDIAQNLISNGAVHILVNNLPNLGLVPGIPAGFEFVAEGFTLNFNSALAAGLANVIGGNIMLLDAYDLTNQIAADPGAYGLTNVDDNCLATAYAGPGTCDGHLFWDDLHPTAAGHILIADAAYAQVIPVPAALPLLLSALLGLGAAKRAREA